MQLRTAETNDYRQIFLMGFDEWAEDELEHSYLAQCHASQKYQQGRWYVLEHEAELVASLIVYRQGYDLPENCVGIGSVATEPSKRRNGYASFLIAAVCDKMREQEISAIYLHSDIDREFYEKLGFVCFSSEFSKCMINCFGVLPASDKVPSYF